MALLAAWRSDLFPEGAKSPDWLFLIMPTAASKPSKPSMTLWPMQRDVSKMCREAKSTWAFFHDARGPTSLSLMSHVPHILSERVNSHHITQLEQELKSNTQRHLRNRSVFGSVESTCLQATVGSKSER
jgi:hypothetical protein